MRLPFARKLAIKKKGRKDYKYKKGIEEKERESFTLSEGEGPQGGGGSPLLISFNPQREGAGTSEVQWSGEVRK